MAFAKALGLALMAVLPGGLVFITAYLLARYVATRMDELKRTQTAMSRSARFRHAFAEVRIKDLMREAKRL